MSIASIKKAVFSDEILQDPYPTYARLHEEGPLHYIEVGKWAVWSIVSHAECASIAKDPRLSAKRAKQMLLPLPISRQSEFSELARMLGGQTDAALALAKSLLAGAGKSA